MTSTLLIKSIPYAVALVLTAGEVPSRLLSFRHRKHVSKQKIEFAARWNKVAEAVGYPFLVLFYALSEITELLHDNKGAMIPAGWLMVGGLLYAGLILMALFFFGADLQDENALPALRLSATFEVPFETLVAITKIAGVLFPAALDLWLTAVSGAVDHLK